MARAFGAALILTTVAWLAGCNGKSATSLPTTPASPTPTSPTNPSGPTPPIYVVLFTHIEDNTPAGTIGTAAARTNYLNIRASLLEMAGLAQTYGVKWSLQTDWKILLAAQQYEDASIMASTGGVNLFRHLRNTLGVAIDPHSHEGGGYNYTDVAYLLSTLDVGGSTVIGGHVWDPAYPQFQQWDRFRSPVSGQRYPQAIWRGDILMGSGTPNHVNDPVISGVWRPRDRFNYFEDDPGGNISCVGAYKGDVAGISELLDQYRSGRIQATCMLTASIHIKPSDITTPGGRASIESSVLRPIASLRGAGQVEATTFTELVATWKREFGSLGCTYNVSPGALAAGMSGR